MYKGEQSLKETFTSRPEKRECTNKRRMQYTYDYTYNIRTKICIYKKKKKYQPMPYAFKVNVRHHALSILS